jgi:dolichyl-phosphate-mannose-protein mannosyltransferase
MSDKLNYFLLKAPHKKQVIFLMLIISGMYMLNFHVNDIWTPNESFYAEAVREMFESGNFLEIFYNYEPRYNKPPLTYWSIAASVSIFGLNEFGIRFPIVLMALGSIWFTYLIGKKLYGEKGGLYAMVMMAFSVQLLAVKQYASPEIPLTFFFTLTMYYFLRGFTENRFKFILFAYISLGLTVLTKGFPYIVVIGGIMGLYTLWESDFKFKRIWERIKFLKLPLGVTVVAIIGLSWLIYMYMKDGQEFWTVYKRETIDRALSKKSNGLKPFFYLEAISWSIVPYSMAFFFALIHWIKNWRKSKEIAFVFSWFIVMLVIFTIAKGKIPTYMIQAHPALLIMIVPLLLNYKPKIKIWKTLWRVSFLLPVTLLIGGAFYLIYLLDLSTFLYALPIIFIVIVSYLVRTKNLSGNNALVALPFWAILVFLICFSLFLPRLEKFRPYDEIGRIVNEEYQIDKTIPIQIEKTLIHNIPYYTKRFANRDQTKEEINGMSGPILALVRDEEMEKLEGFQSIWSGRIYDSASESLFFIFVSACVNAENGDFSAFAPYQLLIKNID